MPETMNIDEQRRIGVMCCWDGFITDSGVLTQSSQGLSFLASCFAGESGRHRGPPDRQSGRSSSFRLIFQLWSPEFDRGAAQLRA